jgi:3-hydroxybutyryl-CoA dehydrogenase
MRIVFLTSLGTPVLGQVSIIGFGLMGAQIAQVFAQAGYSVRAYDVSEAQLKSGLELIRNGKYGLESSVSKGRITQAEAGKVMSRIVPVSSLEGACKGSDFILEAIIEDLQTKREIFQKASEVASKEAILASNTSTLSISKISDPFPLQIRSRMVGMHFFNPPQVMKLVEIVRTKETQSKVISIVQTIVASLQKTAILVFDIPGFVANRIGISVFAEASSLLERGIASVRDIDLAMRLGYGYPMGPFELGDLVGLDSRLRNMEALYFETNDERFKPPKILEKLVSEGYLGDPKTKKGSKGGYYEYFGLRRLSKNET